MIKYEQPLNERVRTLLRLEFLFNLIDYFQDDMSETDIRMILNTLFDVADLIGRSDIKGELIKELERQNSNLEALQGKPGVDTDRLNAILDDIGAYLSDLRSAQYQPGQMLRQDELLATVKQRNTIPGGTCNFDLPSYYHWLHRSREEHAARLKNWQSDLVVIKNSVFLALHLIRNSSRPSAEMAENGFYQRALEAGANCQLIRVLLPEDAACYPEISGGRHRFTVRFMEQPDTFSRPTQVKRNVEFQLYCCML